MFKGLTFFEKITLAAFEFVTLLLTVAGMLAIALSSPSLNEAGVIALTGFGLLIFTIVSIGLCFMWDVDV